MEINETNIPEYLHLGLALLFIRLTLHPPLSFAPLYLFNVNALLPAVYFGLLAPIRPRTIAQKNQQTHQ